jgi:PAS domain S-box-containing protein
MFAAMTGLLGGAIAYSIARDGFIESAKERVELVRNERARAITTLVNNLRIGLASLITRPGLARDLEELSAEFHKLGDKQREAVVIGYTVNSPFPVGSRSAVHDLGDGSGYSAKHKAVHDRLLTILQLKELDDLLLVDLKGDIIYTVAKEPEFGTNLLSGPYRDTGAGQAFRRALSAEPPWQQVFVDMAQYDPAGGPAAFMAQAVRDDAGQTVGVVIFQLNNSKFREVANHIQDLGETGEVYLVGADAARRSNTRFSEGGLTTEKLSNEGAVRSAAGFTATTITKNYKGTKVIASYAPLDLMGVRWGIVSNIDLDEALAPLHAIAVSTLAGILLSTVVIALLGYATARRISRPLDKSLRVMEKLSQGNLHVEIEDGNGVFETRQISASLRTFHGNLVETQRLMTEVTKNQEQLANLLNSSPTGVIVISNDNEVLFANDPAMAILGKDKGSFIGTTFSFAGIAVSENDANRMIIAARREGLLKDTELAVQIPDRGRVVLSISIRRTLYLSQDAFLLWFNDITQQKTLQTEVEAALANAKEERARTEAILAGAPDPIIIVRPDSTIEYVNDQVTKVLGYAPSELVGEALETLIPQRFRNGHKSQVVGFFEAGRIRMMGEGRELFALAKSGAEVPVAIALSPVKVGDKSLVVAAVRDITEQKKAAAELRESQQLLSGVVQNSKTVIFVKRHGRYIMVNRAWEEMTGISAEEARNKTDLEVFDEVNARRIMENDQAVIAARAPAEYEEPVQARGKIIHFLSLKFPFFNERGEVDGLCGMSTDITERIAAEKAVREARDAAEAATKAKSDFLASMSHEIRTPMNGITGMVDVLSQTNLDDEQRHMLRTIRESGNALITVINDILDFSKIEAGKLDLESVTMSIVDAVEGVAATLTPNAVKKNVRIHLFVDPQLPVAVHGDPTRLRQILFNLGGNAVKFSNGNDVQIRALPAAKSDDKRIWVRFNVIDKGIGISKENQSKLFQAFSQAESSTTRKFGGTGLGLAICKRLTGMMDGTIGVDSQEGQGSTFWVELPFQIAEGAKSSLKERDLRGLKVLLVGSDGPRAEVIETYIRHWGADISTAKDVDTAISMVNGSDGTFDAIILDLGLEADRQEKATAALRRTVKKNTMIVLQDYQNRGARIADKDVVTVDANPLVRYRLISAVAVAAGRASPEIKTEDDAAKFAPAKAPSVDEARAKGQLILLAEDNLTNQDVIRRQLNLIGYTCETTANGVEALSAYQTGCYALLLTDCHMPEMDGYELTGKIRGLEKGSGRRFPIIAVTANALQGEAERCLAAGMDDYVSKPIAMPALVAALKKWMPPPRENATGQAKDESAGSGEESAAKSAKAPKPRPAHANGQSAVIDERAIKDTFGDDEDTFKEILLSFVDPSRDIIADILSASEKRSAGGVKEAAHKLKSSARTVGANELADTCAALETAGKASDWPAIEDLSPKARDQFAAVEMFINNL